jgi:hypothetical protein
MNLDGSDVQTVLTMDGDPDPRELNTSWNPVPPDGAS